jgi:hypothetical protein
MRWDERLAGLFDDLEQQAEGLALADRDAEVAEALRAEYSQLDLASRLFASLGARVRLQVSGVGGVEGLLRRAGEGWCLLDTAAQEWVVRLSAVTAARGLVDRGVVSTARPLTARLGLGSVLRGLGEARADTVLHRTDGTLLRGRLGRVGADFVELAVPGDAEGYDDPGRDLGPDVVPFAALAAVRSV